MGTGDGTERTGVVGLVDFDRGVIETLGGVIVGNEYVIQNIPNITPPPNYDGVPIKFAFPDEIIDQDIFPSIVVRRDSISWAMGRWAEGNTQYRVPAPGSHLLSVNHPISGDLLATGFDSYEEKSQPVPVDLLYTIQIRARYRNNLGGGAQQILQYVWKIFQPYCVLYVTDSIADTRAYDAFNESVMAMDTQTDVTNRGTNFNISLRVEGELDLNDPYTIQSLTSLPTINTSLRKPTDPPGE